MQTSIADRTSPVLRGKWIMEVLIGHAAAAAAAERAGARRDQAAGTDGKPLTTRERMEEHRKNPTCNVVPPGTSIRSASRSTTSTSPARGGISDNGVPVDTHGDLYDGTPIQTARRSDEGAAQAPDPARAHFTENLMAYALGRRVEDFDQPTIRVDREAG